MLRKTYLFSLLSILALEPASAMHIMEGYLPLSWCLFWYAVSLPFLVVSYRYIKGLISGEPRMRLTFAINVAFVFVLSALKLPSVTGSSSHLTGTTLGTLISGVKTMPLVGMVVLLFQALLLAHGGLSTLGANIFSLAVAGPLMAMLVYGGLQRIRLNEKLAVGLATFVGSMSTYLTTSLQLALVFPDSVSGVWGAMLKFMSIFAITQIPLSVVEAILTVAVVALVRKLNQPLAGESQQTARFNWGLTLGAVLAITLPILAGYIDFGGGTDDAAGGLVQSIAPHYEPQVWLEGIDLGETAEPWLFALQVLIGLIIFYISYRTFSKLNSSSK